MTDLLVVSDFNAELVARYLTADRATPSYSADAAPYGQVFQTLAGFDGKGLTSLFVWTRPEGISEGWGQFVEGLPVPREELLADVDRYVGALRDAAATARSLFVGSWVSTRIGRGSGMLEWQADGRAHRLAEMNLRLADALADIDSAYLLDSQAWIDAARPARDSKFWHSIKSPFAEGVMKAAALDVKAALRARAGKSRKLLLLDLDDTMWGGVVGDDGWENLRLGGHDKVGEAHVDFQRAARTLAQRGIVLGVVSKNDEAVALTAIDSHPEMLIRRDQLAGWRINWQDKATNIVALTEELNLGLDAVVFIDDNPTERGRVREALPQVLVPEMPANVAGYADVLRQLDCFDVASLTAEDRQRTDMYVADRTRRDSAVSFTSPAEWLKSLDIRVGVASLAPGNIKRVVQLVNKTNQLNMATRRLTESELETWLAQGQGRQMRVVTVADRFGDLGLTGIIAWQVTGDDLEITDFIMSCRAMGRDVERTMVCLAVESAVAVGANRVVARYLPTARNRPTLEFWQGSGFAELVPHEFTHPAAAPYPRPEAVHVEMSSQ